MRIHVLFEHGLDYRSFGSASIRLLRPLTHPQLQHQLQVSAGTVYNGEPVDLVILDRLWRPDVSLELVSDLVKELHQRGIKLIYSLDDNFFDIPDDHNVKFPDTKLNVVDYLLREADGVLVNTNTLKEKFQEYNHKIFVIPHALDERLLVPRVPGDYRSPWRKRRKIIGYMGTFTHDEDLLMISPALHTVFQNRTKEIEFQIIGGIGNTEVKDSLADLPVRYINTEPGEEDYPLFLLWYTSQIDWDLALAPLRDIPFNRVKSDIKFLDYCAIGAAGIFSNIPAYHTSVQHMTTGWLSDNQVESWTEAIETLLRDESLRINIARSAHTYLYSKRILAQCAHQWADIFREILGD